MGLTCQLVVYVFICMSVYVRMFLCMWMCVCMFVCMCIYVCVYVQDEEVARQLVELGYRGNGEVCMPK